MMKNKTVIVGCGIIGLTTGITLLEAGYQIKIITDKLPHDTTSAIAAAVWLPYEVKPFDKVSQWSKESYSKYLEFIGVEKSGISIIEMTSIIEKEEDAWWIDLLPEGKIRKADPIELPGEYKIGLVLQVPMIETQLHLSYLLEQFQDMGGTLEKKKINKLSEINDVAHIINCTGLGSKELVNDSKMYPIRGQIVYLKPKEDRRCIVSEIVSGELQDELAYIVPRSDYTVLGGTATKGAKNIELNQSSVDGVFDRCYAIDSSLDKGDISHSVMGLRPGRTEIRLEHEASTNIIHNYGHGGGGFTVAWGCAKRVLQLVKDNE